MITRANGLLTDESRKLLSQLLGQNIFMLYTRYVGIRSDRNIIIVPDISFSLQDKVSSKSFLIVRPIWEEDVELEDYGWLEIIISGTPEKIRYDHGSPMHPGSTGLCSHISLTPASPIHRITLFQKNLWPANGSSTENWPFHFAILFEHKERFQYLISYQRPNVVSELEFTFDADEIKSVRKTAETEEIIV